MSDRDTGGDAEISIGLYVGRVLRRWYIVLACVVLAVLIGYAAGSGTKNTYSGKALVFLGAPLAPNNATPLSTAPQANGLTPGLIVRQPIVIKAAADVAGLKYSQLTGHISTQLAATGISAKTNTTPFVTIAVQGPWGRKAVANAANSLAQQVVNMANAYTDPYTQFLRQRVAGERAELDSLNGRLKVAQDNLGFLQRSKGSALEHAVAVTNALSSINGIYTRLSQLEQIYSTDQQNLILAQQVERSYIQTRAIGTKVTAASRRASLAVAVLLGLIVGIALALASYHLPSRRPVDGPA